MARPAADALPGLTAELIETLAATWHDDGLWSDIAWLACRFWGADGAGRIVAWHHLVLAVGNFKRQPGRRLHPATLHDLAVQGSTRRAAVAVPTRSGELTVARDDARSWALLDGATHG